MTPPAVVAVINTSADVIDMLRFSLERAGFVVVTATTDAIRDGEIDLEHFARQHEPGVIVYDIAPPYEENFRLFQHLRASEALRDRAIVLTTTNARHLVKLVEEGTVVHEVVGKPYDLDQIVTAVEQAAQSRGTR